MRNKDEKYVVYKKDAAGVAVGYPLEDAVVIRLQDVMAAPGLHAYANNVQTAIEVMELSGVLVPSQLYVIRDYFHDRAIAAEMLTDRKLPD